ncbi:MAG TPA: HAD family hydrolase [Candidatus Limnocylindrales bacterium]
MGPLRIDPLAGIDLVVFDKDGTLIDFQAMWGGWVGQLVAGLERETGEPFGDRLRDVLGVDGETGLVRAHGLLAATPMARIREVVLGVVADRLGDPARAAAVVEDVWQAPDPVTLARPVGDLRALLLNLREAGRRIAIATSDDRAPTERTLAALGIADVVDDLACADDGLGVKPSPDAVHHLCRTLGVVPARTAVVGDSVADLAMGRAAGAGRVIGVLTGVADEATLAPLADVVLPSVQELLARE